LKSSIEQSASDKHKQKSKGKHDHCKKLAQKLNTSDDKTVPASQKDVALERNDSLEDLSQCALFLCELDT
jgi:hypothetical protein